MHRKILLLLLLLALLPINKIYASVNSIYELNDPKYTLGVSDKGAAFDAVKRDFPRAKLAYYDGVDGFMAVKTSKIDAYINDRITMILALKNGFEGVKILPGSVGEPIKIAVGISRKSKIPDLRKKINEFIAILNSDGTLNDMKERWVFDSNYTMPEINTTSSPKFKLVVGTVGMIPPYSFYEGNKLTGHDIEFVKRFAAWLGADIEFKDYDFAGVVAAAVTGNIDIVAANLQISSERAEKIDFSDIIMSSDFSVMVRDDSPKKVDSHNSIKYLNGKNIGIQTGNPEWDKIIKQILPASNILYYNTFTDLLAALKAHRIDSFPGDEANLKFIAEEDKSVMILDEDITETYGLSFAFTKADLRNKFNDFMKEIKADGRLNSITAKWTTESGNKIAVDYESLPSTNGTLTFATEGEYPPFNYVLNGKIAGMEIDLAYEFCKLYGYGLNVLTMNYEAIPAAITSNKADFSANLTIDDEHKEALIFSVPYYYCATKLMVLKNDPPAKPANNSGYSSLQDLNGKRIGVITGSIHPEIVLPVLPDAELFYFNTKADEVAALVSGKIDAFLCSEPEAISLMSENNNLSYMNTRLSHFNLAYCTAKNSKGAALAEELSKFIRELENNGTLSKLRDKWFRSSDESQKPLEDYSQLPAKNGVIRFAQFAHGVPFTYLRDNIIVGYEVDILVKFCKEKGYGLEVITMDFGGILPAVMSGKCDVAGGGIIITPERSEQVNFTEPIYHSGTVLMTLKSNLADDNKLAQKISDFNGKRIGVLTGSITPEIVKSTLPASERFYFDSPSDEIAALLANKIDAFVYSRIEANTMIAASENDNLSYLNEPLSSFELAFCTAKTPKGKALADELNEFLRRIDNDGTLKILRDKWLTDSKSQKTLAEDYSQLPAKNGVIKFAQTGIFPPFSYVSNGKTVGYDIEIIAKFCKEKGYGLEIFTMNFAGILAGIDSGRFDMGGGGLIITPERAEKVNFTLPNYKGDFVIVAMKSDSAGDNKFIANLDDLDGKRIGALTGSIFPELIKSRLPSANIFYFSSRADEAAALTAGKIDAFALSEPEAMSAESENSKLTYIHEYINKFDFAYCLAKNNKLTPELSKFIADLESNGILSKWRDKWFRGTDESQKTLEDYSNLPAKSGVITFAQDGASAPFAYVRDNRVVGYEIEILANFCREKGYKLEIVTMDLSAMIPALQSGKCDIAGGGVAVTDERAEKVDFTTPDFNSGSVLVVLKSPVQPRPYVRDFDGKKIALSSVSIYDKLVKERLKHSEILYMNNYANQIKSLIDGKIDAVVRDEPEAIMLKNLYPQLVYTQDYLTRYANAFIAAKNEHGDSLLAGLNEFIRQSESNGTLQKLRDVWFSADESKKVMTDYENLPDTNGVIKFAVDIEIPPFAYVRDNKIVGYEVEIMARFCKEKGYKLEIEPVDFSGILASVVSGKYDLGGSAISITEERAQNVNFSEPIYRGGGVLIALNNTIKPLPGLKDFDGKKIAVSTGNIADKGVRAVLPNAEIFYIESTANQVEALNNGKVDAFGCDEPQAMIVVDSHPSLTYIHEYLINYDNAFFAAKNDKGSELIAELNEFIKREESNGTLENLRDVWFSADESKKVMTNYENLPAVKGVIKIALCGEAPPYDYMRDNKLAGYCVEILARFCMEKGYKPEFNVIDFNAIIPAVQSGKCDLGGGEFSITAERAEKVNFSEPIYSGGSVLVIKKPGLNIETDSSTDTSAKFQEIKNYFAEILSDLESSFERTFLRENRWHLFIEGTITTLIITVLAILFGTILGFAVYMMCRRGNIIANLFTKFFVWLLHGMPMVVLLMILYYVIFSSVSISGLWVAVIAFTLTFGASVYAMILSGVGAVDKGQTEAALALGFSDIRTFFTVILPQAALHFMPSYKAAVVELIKATAIVGYIAVQDLTKMGDIVRSRTYEAFFPLIAVAVIYFILAGILNLFFGRIHNNLKPEHRKPSDILRGIDTNRK